MLQDDADSGSVDSSVKKPEPKPVAAAPVKKTAPPPKKENNNRENKPRGDGSSRGGRGGNRNNGDRRGNSDYQPRGEGEVRVRGEAREPRQPRGDKGTASRDRHSRGPKGSGQQREKKDGHGRHNWGDDLQAQAAVDGVVPEVVDGAADTEPAAPKEPTPEELAAKAEREAEEKQMTLADYQKQQAEKRVATTLSVRQAGEGVDNSEWKDTVVLSKSDEQSEGGVAPGQKKGKKKGNKKAISEAAPIDIKYNDEQQQGGRGGSGGRGRGGRGGQRGGRGGRSSNAPSLADESAFPSL